MTEATYRAILHGLLTVAVGVTVGYLLLVAMVVALAVWG